MIVSLKSERLENENIHSQLILSRLSPPRSWFGASIVDARPYHNQSSSASTFEDCLHDNCCMPYSMNIA